MKVLFASDVANFCVCAFSVYMCILLCMSVCYSTGWSIPVKYGASFLFRVCLILLLSGLSSITVNDWCTEVMLYVIT